MEQIRKLVDVHGMISRIRGKLPTNCAVRKSPFCDQIIAMRMQGVPFLDIEKFLISQGPKYRISGPTIWRNLDRAERTGISVHLPLAEELKERWGGDIDLDLVREMSNQVFLQRQRIDHLVRQELETQKTHPKFSNKLIRAEMETLNSMIANLNKMLKAPLEAAEERAKADQITKGVEPSVMALSEDAEAMLTDVILNGGLKVNSGDSKPKSVN